MHVVSMIDIVNEDELVVPIKEQLDIETLVAKTMMFIVKVLMGLMRRLMRLLVGVHQSMHQRRWP